MKTEALNEPSNKKKAKKAQHQDFFELQTSRKKLKIIHLSFSYDHRLQHRWFFYLHCFKNLERCLKRIRRFQAPLSHLRNLLFLYALFGYNALSRNLGDYIIIGGHFTIHAQRLKRPIFKAGIKAASLAELIYITLDYMKP